MRTFTDSVGRSKTIDPERFPHGTRARYVAGCSEGYKGHACFDCTEANRVYIDELVRRQREGQSNPLVSTTRARNYLRKLQAAGIGTRRASQVGAVSRTVLEDIRSGRKKRIRKDTESAILGIRLDAGQYVPAGPTWALIDELLALGYPGKWINEQLGHAANYVQLARTQIRRVNETKVRELYDDLKRRGLLTREASAELRRSRSRWARG